MVRKRIPFLFKLAVHSRPLLKNWRALLLGTIREFRGIPIPEAPVMETHEEEGRRSQQELIDTLQRQGNTW